MTRPRAARWRLCCPRQFIDTAAQRARVSLSGRQVYGVACQHRSNLIALKIRRENATGAVDEPPRSDVLESGIALQTAHQLGTEVDMEIGSGEHQIVYPYPSSKAAQLGVRTA